jgi:TolB-like protein
MAPKNIGKTAVLPALLALILSGCATTVDLKVQRPPTLNTAGIKRIAIMPFEAVSHDRLYREMAQYATSAATSKIHAINYFTLVDSSEIERLRRNNQSIENYADALFIGRITRLESRDGTSLGQYKNKEGETVYYTIYERNVEIEFNYSIMRSRDGSLIGPVSKRGSNSSSSQNIGEVRSTTDLLRSIVDRQLSLLGHDIAPYTVTESRTLAKDTSKDKVLQAEMKDALAQVKAGSYRIALEAYLGIYERYSSFAAAENASILYEAFGDTQTAANFMQRVFEETGNFRAREVLARLDKILQDKAILANEYADARGKTERVAAFASDEIQKVLPKDARVWIYNNASNNSLAGAVVDNITSSFIRKGIRVVDRQNTALIEAEQRLQMSGYVSDDDFVSIGNAAGANTIVIIGIIGSGAIRRLQVQVLDIEKGVTIMQSDTGEKWQL